MPSTPTTKSQVQAYRFVLRRMQSALVRKDAVMLHDPMRTHSRATIVGVCIAALGMLGFLIWGILSPKAKPPNENGIVIGKPSGQVYVMIAEPADQKKLIPVFNMASARLLLMAQQEKAAGGDQGGQPAEAQGAVKVVDPEVVDDNELRDIPRGRKMGIPNGPDLLPGKDQRIDPYWAVCDGYETDKSDPDGVTETVRTTVIAGEKDLGTELPNTGSVLVEAPNKETFLVYRAPRTLNQPNTQTVRAKVDLSKPEVENALGVANVEPRKITLGLLNAIPTAPDLEVPAISGKGDKSTAKDDDGTQLTVGDVYKVEFAGEGFRHYVVQEDGLELIKASTANLLASDDSDGRDTIPSLSQQAATTISQQDRVDDKSYPEGTPEALTQQNLPVVCLGWETFGSGENVEQRTTVYVNKTLPKKLKPDARGNSTEAVKISTPNTEDIRIDYFYMPPGRGAIVRQASSPAQFTNGNIVLISDRGIRYGIPDARTAQGLGLEEQKPAPENIVGLLPDGAMLTTADVEQSFDTAPAPKGEREQQNAQGGG